MPEFNLDEELKRLARNTEFRARRAIASRISSNNQKDFSIAVTKEGENVTTFTYIYRDSLKFQDMGVGRGQNYEKARAKINARTGRRPQRIINQYIYRMIRLMKALGKVEVKKEIITLHSELTNSYG